MGNILDLKINNFNIGERKILTNEKSIMQRILKAKHDLYCDIKPHSKDRISRTDQKCVKTHNNKERYFYFRIRVTILMSRHQALEIVLKSIANFRVR